MVKDKKLKVLIILGIIWLLGVVCDRIWFAIDRSMPAWDQAEYLTGTLNYAKILQTPQFFSENWWKSFWLLSSKIPPLTYIVAGIFQNIFGTGIDQATLIYILFSAILLGSVYGLGAQLFSVEVGLWAAALCQLFPALYKLRLDFLLDYPLTAIVTLAFFCLTKWQYSYNQDSKIQNQKLSWFWAFAFGVSLGLAILVKQTALFFLFAPILWVLINTIRQKTWVRLGQIIIGLLVSVAVFGPWYRTNWLIVLTAGKRATVDSAIAEGDPALNTLAAWTYYWKELPSQLSWPLLLVPIVGLIIYRIWKNPKFKIQNPKLVWLAVFLIGSYLLSSLNINKDDRYIVPYLPVLSLFLAYGLTLWRHSWGNRIRWGTVGLAILIMWLNLFPFGQGNVLAKALSPKGQHYPYTGVEWPHAQVIQEIITTEPFLRSTLGILPSTPTVNQHNLNYFGALRDFQVYGRQVGTRQKFVPQDARSLSWFVTKTDNQGSVPPAQAAIVQSVEQSPDFTLHKTWNLPDSSNLNLYHSRIPPIQVKPLSTPRERVILEKVVLPQQAPPGKPLPITYEWSGSGEQLRSGLVLLTWKLKPQTPESETTKTDKSLINPNSLSTSQNSQSQWLHDHGIGLGSLNIKPTQQLNSSFQVIEHLSMLPPVATLPGTYTLEATYLNRDTGETYPINVSPITLNIDPSAATIPAPELDLTTQLRTLASNMSKGVKALEQVFDEVGRINQYDPVQDYLVQTQITAAYRLQTEPQNLDLAYTLVLSRVLKRQATEAIAALKKVTEIDPNNPYGYGYLAFVYLYDWHPHAAETAINSALALNPNIKEIQALKAVAVLMQGRLFQAWQIFQQLNYKQL